MSYDIMIDDSDLLLEVFREQSYAQLKLHWCINICYDITAFVSKQWQNIAESFNKFAQQHCLSTNDKRDSFREPTTMPLHCFPYS